MARGGIICAIYLTTSAWPKLPPLTPASLSARQPDWSPDGTKIAFSTHCRNPQNEEIWTVDSKGGVLHFGETVRLNIEAPWRLISEDSILVTREDDGQKFGLPMPVDAESELRKRIEGHRVTSAAANPATSDLTLQFDNAFILEVLNLSSGYECWTLNPKDGSVIVGRNG